MYVIVRPDVDDALRLKSGDEHKNAASCPVGQWVTVSRNDGWVPSSSVVWHQASSLFSSVFGTYDAEAHQRDHKRS
jgi:hypothetical protein